MNRLVERTVAEGIAQHLKNPVRTYSEDAVQKDRIARTRDFAEKSMHAGGSHLVEVGCGAADISGYLAVHRDWRATGIDCHQPSLLEANLRYGSHFTGIIAVIEAPAPGPLLDLVILSEVLEHLNNPAEIAAGWLNRARASVISHPLNESKGSVLSGGDHAWSFSVEDHEEFFHLGHHEIDETVKFGQGAYTIILSRGHHK